MQSNNLSENGIQPTPFQQPIRIGLTGSIGMGKSTITKQFLRLGFPVFDADQAVHQLYSKEGAAVEPLRAVFPSAVKEDAVDRSELSRLVLTDPSVLAQIEKIVHPLVIEQRRLFTQKCIAEEELMIVYDIPLLFEKIEEYRETVDVILVVSCDEKTQEKRVMQRPNMTKEKFTSILSKQVPDEEKRKRADYVIDTGYESFVEGRAQLATILETILLQREPGRFQHWITRPGTSGVKGEEEGRRKRRFDAVIFDLDDTLCPITPVLRQATETLIETTATALPRLYAAYSSRHQPEQKIDREAFLEDLRKEMHRIKQSSPLIAHDLTEVRRRALLKLAQEHQEDDGCLEGVEACLSSFLKRRSEVTPHLYEDSLSALTFLKKQADLQIGILTNGNCDFHHSEELQVFLDFALSASETGCSKPSLTSFLAAMQRLKGTPPHRVLFIGDDYERDVLGAARIGMKTAYLMRDPQKYQEILSRGGDNHLRFDYLLQDLSPSRLEQVIFIDDLGDSQK